MPVEILGFAATALTVSMWLPQVWRSWRHRADLRALASLSLPALAIGACFNALLIVYGSLQSAWPVVTAGSVNVLCTTTLLGLRVRA